MKSKGIGRVKGGRLPALNEKDVLAMPFSDAISFLASIPRVDDRIPSRSHFPAKLRRRAETTLQVAMTQGDENALAEVHRALFVLYELHVADPAREQASNQFSLLLTGIRLRLERRWLEDELRKTTIHAVSDSSGLIASIRDAVHSHAASNHPLFDWLERFATLEQVRGLFRSDAPLNIRFFDLIVMAMIGSLPEARAELASNFWDEAGRGDGKQSHVSLFRRVLDETGIGQVSDDFASTMTWQGLRGYNLFMVCALNRHHYFKLLGIMAATELLDPPQYRKLVAGCRRIGLAETAMTYYEEHVSVDEMHGEGWLNNVIQPVTARTPGAMRDVLAGCMLRLSSCNAYYDDLYHRLM